jgi:hypothetical protein
MSAVPPMAQSVDAHNTESIRQKAAVLQATGKAFAEVTAERAQGVTGTLPETSPASAGVVTS